MQDEEGDPHDPFAELVDGSNVFVKIETKFADEEHSILEDLSFDMAADGAIRQETSIDGITSEWVSTVLKWKRGSIQSLLTIHTI